MAAALALGRQGRGRTAPNPSVGAVLVRFDSDTARVVGVGRTADGGRPHAEVAALAQAGTAARGATCYVTLEPCSHHGRSPPCADALVRAGVGRVVVAARDPNPLVAGGGIAMLENAHIPVTLGVMAAEAEQDLAGHLSVMSRGRPQVTAKMALATNGAIGVRGQGHLPISGARANGAVQILRAERDAIMVGVGTVLADNPRLTVRLPGMASRSPTRVVLDSAAQTPPGARLFDDAADVPVLVLVGQAAPAARMAGLRAAGAVVVQLPGESRRIRLEHALACLAGRGLNDVLVECGATLADALHGEGLIDEAILIETPTVLPPGPSVAPFEGRGVDALAPSHKVLHVTAMGADRWVHLIRR